MARRGQAAARGTGKAGPARSGGAALVPIDQEPLRSEAAEGCTEAMANLECARAKWHHFESKDKPAFARWRAREFGQILSTAREVETQIAEHQALIHEIEMEMRRGFHHPRAAYERVMFRRTNPDAVPEPEMTGDRSSGNGAARRLTEFEQEALFQDWIRRSLGTNPDKMDDAAYSTSFEMFKSHMFQAAPANPPHNGSNLPRPKRHAPEEEPEENLDDEVAHPVDRRLKELYRRLVRRLHPDLRQDGTCAVTALWHDVQEAYAAGDVPRMEILLAVSDITSNRIAAGISVSQLRAVRADLHRAFRALNKSLLEAEAEDAWDFARLGPNDDLYRRVERELKAALSHRITRRDLLARTLASWAGGTLRSTARL